LLLSVAVLAVYAASDADKNAIYNKMLQTCEDVSAAKITKEEAVKQVDHATDGFTLTAEDKEQLKDATTLLKGIVGALGDIPKEHRGAFKGLCDKSKLQG
ncbi:hypothetical protein PMAYCL1PPCAC_28794, partial [Pristionchus mayeri]